MKELAGLYQHITMQACLTRQQKYMWYYEQPPSTNSVFDDQVRKVLYIAKGSSGSKNNSFSQE